MKIGVYRMVIGAWLLLMGMGSYNLDIHIDCAKYSSSNSDEKTCNDFQNNDATIKSIPSAIGAVLICLSFINPNEENNNTIRYFQNTNMQVCPICKEELSGRAWCGNKPCIEFWREKYVC